MFAPAPAGSGGAVMPMPPAQPAKASRITFIVDLRTREDPDNRSLFMRARDS